jgi:two-component system chemotaxis response regulator CheY
MNDELLADDITTLLAECAEKLDEVEVDLVALGQRLNSVPKELVNRIFRAFHSIKGAAAYLRHAPLKQLSHLTESVLEEVRDQRLQLSSTNIELLLSAADRMRQMTANGQLHAEVDFRKDLERLIALLRGQRNQAPLSDQQPSPTTKVDLPFLRPLRMLVVEDDFSSRVVLQGLLSKYGLCHIAVNGREAVEAFRAARNSGQGYDLICMDVHMPEMDGREAVEQIRAIETNDGCYSEGVKVFMTTAIRDIRTIVASFKAICDVYLLKPIDGNLLEDHLSAFALIRKTSSQN